MSDAHGIARDQLRSFIARIERLEEEKKTIADDIKDVYGEAKGMGYDTKIMKMVIALRKKDEQERTEQELILDTYLAALGMIPEPFAPEEQDAGEVTIIDRDDRDGNRLKVTVDARVAKVLNGPATSPLLAPSEEVSERIELNSPEQATEKATSRESDGEQNNSGDGKTEPGILGGEVRELDANTGGDDEEVAQPQYAATHQAGASFKAPATFSLRPDCRNPGETCAGHGTTLCHSCKVAMREREVA